MVPPSLFYFPFLAEISIPQTRTRRNYTRGYTLRAITQQDEEKK